MKIRQDAWSHEDDLLLAETVLRHVREGSTQLNAFEEVGDKLNRTSAACGFRWNAEVREKYNQAMEIAKKQRKQRKRGLVQQSDQSQSNERQEEIVTSNQPIPLNHSQSYYLNRQVETTGKSGDPFDLNSVISFLETIRSTGLNSQNLRSENERLTRENKQFLEERGKLERKLQKVKQQYSIIQEDYQALVQIMDRARRMVSLEDEDERISLPPNFTSNSGEELDQIAK